MQSLTLETRLATRIVHISDLHCPARDFRQADALIESIVAAAPDLTVASGDMTRRGRNREYRVAADLLSRLPGRRLVVPGNHDVPISGIIGHRFQRFSEYFPGQPLFLETQDVFLVGLNTALGSRFGDWSLGDAPRSRTEPVVEILREKVGGRLGVVVCHHPLRSHVLDVRRSTTARGPEAFAELASAGMKLLLHGHLHRSSRSCVEVLGGSVCELCANTALSDRERAGAAGYNIVDVDGLDYTVTATRWTGDRYELSATL